MCVLKLSFACFAVFFIANLTLSSCQDELYPRMEVIPPPRRPVPELANNNIGWGNGFMTTARSFVASPTGQMAVQMAKEFISRSAGGNQVLSLNLTRLDLWDWELELASVKTICCNCSLLIIVLLKALIFSTGLLGAGNYSQYGRGRGLEGSELNWQRFVGIVFTLKPTVFRKIPSSTARKWIYSLDFWLLRAPTTMGASTAPVGALLFIIHSIVSLCLSFIVCMAPEHGAEYLKAGQALLEGFGIFDP